MGDYNLDFSSDSELSSVPPSPTLAAQSSPEPAERYPTPSSQEGAESAEGSARQARPAKRRRNPLPKERTTQYLDLSRSLYEQMINTICLFKLCVIKKTLSSSPALAFPRLRVVSFCFWILPYSNTTLNSPHSSGFPLHRWSLQIIAEKTQLESFRQASL
jgi:hypothetical protein